jgi:hypothetical protein
MNVAEVCEDVGRVARDEGRTWLERIARFGCGVRGAIYVIIGGLSLMSVIAHGGRATDTHGAVLEVFAAPGGWMLVLVIAVGLLGYSAWRLCQGLMDADRHGADPRGMAIRAGMVISGVTHLLLAFWAGKLALGLGRGEHSETQDVIATPMSQPLGPWLVGVVGFALIGVGIGQFVIGTTASFEQFFAWDAAQRRRLLVFCRCGLYARGVIFGIIGCFIVYAAIKADPSEAGGVREALIWLRQQPYGDWLLGIVGTGLMCFGLYSVVEGLYRRVRAPV